MADPNPSTFLGNIQQKITKQVENSDFYSIFHLSIATANLLKILDMLIGESIWNMK